MTIQGCEQMELTYDNVIQYIIDEFPQLVHEYKDEYEWAKTEDGVLTYVFFEPIVRNHFYKLVTCYSNEQSEDTLLEIHRFSELFENMAISQDFDVRNLLIVGLFEGMEPTLHGFVRSILGPESKKLLELGLMTYLQVYLGIKPTGFLDIETYNAIMHLATNSKSDCQTNTPGKLRQAWTRLIRR